MDKTSESFILAIERMAIRKCMPKIIHSDNVSEFVTANNHTKPFFNSLNTANTHKNYKTNTISNGITVLNVHHSITES